PRDLNPEVAEMLRLPVRTRVLITGVRRGGAAAKAGIQPGDVVLKVGPREVANTAELLSAVSALAPDSRVSLLLQRGQQSIERSLVVAQRPAPRREPAD
ncbi:MAG: PDZ domain-containing protein, partial [Betaproteobacteria bacterium]